MKKLLGLFIVLCCFTGIAQAEDIFKTNTQGGVFKITNVPFVEPEIKVKTKVMIVSSGDGRIEIGYDGKVKLINITLDEASKLFWERIGEAFQPFKQKIIANYIKEQEGQEGQFKTIIAGKEINWIF